jgi:hypothetical protein
LFLISVHGGREAVALASVEPAKSQQICALQPVGAGPLIPAILAILKVAFIRSN